MNKFIPGAEQLKDDITAIFIDEDLDYDYTLSRLIYHLDSSQANNKPDLTYEECIRKYKSHIDQWNSRNQATERRGFLGKPQAAKWKNFLEFLETRLYNIDWDSLSSIPDRDLYLFGDIKQDFLSEQRKSFIGSLKFHEL
jgi:hypothetical protein